MSDRLINSAIRAGVSDEGFPVDFDIPLNHFAVSGDPVTSATAPLLTQSASAHNLIWAPTVATQACAFFSIPSSAADAVRRLADSVNTTAAYRLSAKLKLFLANGSAGTNDGAINITLAARALRLTPPINDASGTEVTAGSLTTVIYTAIVKSLPTPGAINTTKYFEPEFDLFSVDPSSGSAVPLLLKPNDKLLFGITPAAHTNNTITLYRARLRLSMNAIVTDPTKRGY